MKLIVGDVCPMCSGKERDGHFPICRLNKILKEEGKV